MGARRFSRMVRKGAGVILAVGGLLIIVRVLPLYLWPLALGILFIWLGWQLYIHDQCYW